ncbi:MAG TPA: helix-turn-helix transcriptional regulator [Vicinamibacterales bacterium]|nr:helix-turn-helix transcriptional regulator [Vicinamibacterales bacterium]
MGERERNRCRERLAALARAPLDADEARRAAIGELRRAIGFERWCWPLTDPDTGLAVSGIGEFDFAPSLARLVALEEHGDLATKPQLMLGARASVALSGTTRGELTRSPRWRECLRPYGIGDEVMTVCRDRYGCWGSVELMRDDGDRPFDEDDVRLLDALAPTLGTLVRRSHVRSWNAGVPADPLAMGTLILDDALSPTGWTRTVRDWLADLMPPGMLPPAVYEIGARVLTPRENAHGLPPTVRIRTRSGRWAVMEGARLDGGESNGVAITIRGATGDEILDVLCKAYGLTDRERQLVAFVRRGLATKELADALDISGYTVQDHLKAIFAKTGVHSRRELMSHLGGIRAASGR